MKPLRLAVVGVGSEEGARARHYLATIKRMENYDLCALCDHSPDALNAAGDRFEVRARYSDFEQMIREERPEAVFVLVPTDGQTAYALTAARMGTHLITEIPYALTLRLGDGIGQACRERGLKWEIAENVWLWPRERLKRKIVESGLLGEINHARLWYPCGAYHGFNAIRMILGCEPKRCLGYAQSLTVPAYTNYGGQPETTKWWESGTIEFENGAVCLYELAPAPGAKDRYWEVEGTGGYLAGGGIFDDVLVRYENGRQVTYPFIETHEEIGGESVLASVKVETDPPQVWENPFKNAGVAQFDDIAKASILQSLYRAVRENIEPAYGQPNARRDMELWIALRESARPGNTWTDLPLSEETGLERQFECEYRLRYGGDPVEDTRKLLSARYNRLSAMWTAAGWL
ncbi:MAG: Gfo/Idh/MocA family oxidoreductase [Armatimonadetes bacterium]|nr:Gfo/Idh/MocA family oxidoreductase [Armatimonadota bacterium]